MGLGEIIGSVTVMKKMSVPNYCLYLKETHLKLRVYDFVAFTFC